MSVHFHLLVWLCVGVRCRNQAERAAVIWGMQRAQHFTWGSRLSGKNFLQGAAYTCLRACICAFLSRAFQSSVRASKGLTLPWNIPWDDLEVSTAKPWEQLSDRRLVTLPCNGVTPAMHLAQSDTSQYQDALDGQLNGPLRNKLDG